MLFKIFPFRVALCEINIFKGARVTPGLGNLTPSRTDIKLKL